MSEQPNHLQSDEILAAIVRDSDDAILSKTLDAVITSWNPGAERMYGYTANEVIGQPVSILVPTNLADDIDSIMARIRRGEGVQHYETVRKHKDGHLIDVSLTVSPVRNRQGQIVGASTIARDITEHRRVEQALKESESRFRSLFEYSPIGVFMTIPDGRVLAANPAACAMLSMSEAEICRAGRERLVDASDPRYAAAYQERQRTGRVIATELNFVRATGERFPAEVDSVILPGDPPQSFVMLRDITERKKAEEVLLRSEKLASLGRMASAFAHEINNPVDVLTNLLFLANETEGLPESTRHLLEMAGMELRRVVHITRQSLGAYPESSAPALTSVTTVLDSVLDLLNSRIMAKHAIIDKQWKGEVQITAVAGDLRQVFSSLVSNSLDAIDERGIIKVRVSNSKQRVRISITDNGKGIPPSILKHVFEPFFTTKDRVGITHGLWVIQQIIAKHGGTIQVRSNCQGIRKGTTFSVLLPLFGSAKSKY